MRLTNKTKIKREVINQIIDKVCKKTKPFIKRICVRYDKDFLSGGVYFPDERRFVIIVAEPKYYPSLTSERDGKKYGYINFKVKSDIESLIFLLAHESRHVWQEKFSKRDWFKKIKIIEQPEYNREKVIHNFLAERDADTYAIKVVKKFRETNWIK